MRIGLLIASLAIGACQTVHGNAAAQSGEVRPSSSVPGQLELESAHFYIRWAQPKSTEAEARDVLEHAERGWDKIVPILGADRAPTQRLLIRLEGDAEQGQIPTVDPISREVLLYRLRGIGGHYTASLVHELVHAFRWPVWSKTAFQTDEGIYVEEALAELVAIEAGFPSQGFPSYGSPIAVVTGSWLSTNDDLSIEALIKRHKQLNFRCMAQAYGLRLGFMSWIRERVGLAPLVALANSETPITAADLERVFGGSLASLASIWRPAALAAFESHPQAKQSAAAYRKETPIQYFNVCGADVLATGSR